MRQLDLQRALARTRAASKYLEDQSCTVDDLGGPGFLEIALLDRRDRAIHDNDRRGQTFRKAGNLVDFAFADVGRRADFAECNQPRFDHGQIDGPRQADGLLNARLRRSLTGRRAYRALDGWPLEPRLNNNRPAGLDTRRCRAQQISALIATAYFQSGLVSRRWLVSPFEELDGVTRHDGRNCVLVDELGMPIPSQQHAEIVEPGHNALQLDAVHQKDGEWDFAFADVIEEGVLQILRTIGCHCRFPVFARV